LRPYFFGRYVGDLNVGIVHRNLHYDTTRVVYHGVTSSFFGIGILPVSDLTGLSVFRSVLLVWRELLFSSKGGLAVSKRGPVPPFSLKKGASAPFLREKGVPAKKMIPKCTDQDFLRYRYGKYREIQTDNTDRKIPIRYNSRHNSQVACISLASKKSKCEPRQATGEIKCL
jgi:hypothetical protein